MGRLDGAMRIQGRLRTAVSIKHGKESLCLLWWVIGVDLEQRRVRVLHCCRDDVSHLSNTLSGFLVMEAVS
jgi:hypothetical protein